MPSVISVLELKNFMTLNDDAILIDVRSRDEFENQHIPGSSNTPLIELADALMDLPTSARIVFICQTGKRSHQACTFAGSLGYEELYNLEGGVNAWTKLSR